MIAAWMLWSIGVGLLFLLAGLAAERLLTLYRRTTRWVWVVAGVGTVLLPGLRMLAPGGGGDSAPGGVVPVTLEPLAVTVAQGSSLRSLDDTLLMGWVVLSSALVVFVLMGAARLWRLVAGCRPGTLLGRPVLWSSNTGPAVVGLVRPRIVLPDWVRSSAAADQELILAHEEEHVRARDAQLRFLMALPLIAFPWNPALWLQYRRLGLGVELDCDRRIMRKIPGQRRIYGDLLINVGARRSGLPGLAVAALSEEPSLLEKRIRDLTWKAPESRVAQAALLLFGAMLVVGVAMAAPGVDDGEPVVPLVEAEADLEAELEAALKQLAEERAQEEALLEEERLQERLREEEREREAEPDDISAAPTFTPFTVAPDITNRREIQAALEAEYPPLLRDAGIGGTTNVWFFIDSTGEVRDVRVNASSGHAALDDAALRVARVFRYSPAMNRDEPTPVWIALDITFVSAEPPSPPREEARATPPQEPPLRLEAVRVDPDGPPATPFTNPPVMLNREEVLGLLESAYPPLLKDAGIEGTVDLWVHLDEDGNVTDTRVNTSSGHTALDRAAIRVAARMEFRPARNEGEPVAVWIAFDVPFRLDG